MQRLKKYNLFYEGFLDKIIKNEIPYLYSERLRSVLLAMSKNGSDIAQELLYSENSSSRAVDDITLIDITDSEDKISFIQLNRVSRFRDSDVDKKDDLLQYIKSIWSSTKGDLNNKCWNQQRTEITVGRFVSRVLLKSKITVSDKNIEIFVNSYKSRIKFLNNIESMFEIVKGEDIRKWYLESTYQSDRGQLANSCMRYKECQEYLDIYTKNDNVCRLLILHGDNPEKIVGRSIIWELSNGYTYMDRQYTNIDSDINVFVEYARKNNWLYYGGNRGNYQIQLGKFEYDKFPYMDTFLFYNHVNNTLTNNEDIWPSTDYYQLQRTNGTFIGGDMVWSEYDDEWIQNDDAVNTYDHGWVRSDSAVYVEDVDRWYTNESELICWSEYAETYYLVDNCVYSEYIETYILSDESIEALVGSDGLVYLPKSMKNLTMKVNINGGDNICLSAAIVPNPFGDGWLFRKDRVRVFYCPSIDGFITELDAKERGLDIQKVKYKSVELINYLDDQIGEVDTDKLLEYLVNLSPDKEIIDKMNVFFESSSRFRWLTGEKNYTNVEKFNILKAGVWFGFKNSEFNDYYVMRYGAIRTQSFLLKNEPTFLKFMDQSTYDRLYTQSYFTSFVSICSALTWDLITDKEMVKIYIHLNAN